MLTLDQPLTRRPRPAPGTPADIDRLPPHSLEAEQAVLGCILLGADQAIPAAIDRIKPDHFYDQRHKTIYEAMLEMYDNRIPIDPISLQQRLKDSNQLHSVGGAGFVSALPDEVPAASNISYYLDVVTEKYRLRAAIALCTAVIGLAYDDPNPSKVFAELDRGTSSLTSETCPKRFDIKESVRGAISTIEALHQRQGTMSGLSTGFIDLDKMTGGLHGGEMIVIAARPSVGKTSLAMNIAESVACNQEQPVGVFSLEMTAESLVLRMLCSRARVNYRNISDGFLSERDFPKLANAACKISKSQIHIDDTPALTLPNLRAKARRMHQLHGIKLFIIDYLTLLHLGSRCDSRQVEVARISNGVKALAKELDVPVIVLAQLNRDLEKGGKGGRARKPRLSDLRESGDIEQDADFVGLLYRAGKDDEHEEADELDAIPVNLDVAKQRNGPTGVVHLTFLKGYTRFESAAKISGDDTHG